MIELYGNLPPQPAILSALDLSASLSSSLSSSHLKYVTVTNLRGVQGYSDCGLPIAQPAWSRRLGMHRAAVGMADELPGFIPQVLRLDDVSLLRADETVFNAMIGGWRAQMLARGLAMASLKTQW